MEAMQRMPLKADIESSGSSDTDTSEDDVANVSCWSWVRLVLLWVGAVICGGFSPGQVLFAELFQKAGFMSDVCEGSGHATCEKQVVVISNLLNVLSVIMLGWAIVGGFVFDSLGARAAGVYGALLLAAANPLIMISLATGQVWLFAVGISLSDVGAMMNNYAFYGLLYHLPGWQGLIIALSNGCIQTAAYLPVAISEFMRLSGADLYAALSCYTLVILMAAAMLYVVVPEQKEYFAKAQEILGLPLPKPKVSFRRIRKGLVGAWRVSIMQGWAMWIMVVVTVLTNTCMAMYSVLAVPFGTAVFSGDKSKGEQVADLWLNMQTLQGLFIVPLTGLVSDMLGLAMLAAVMAVSLVSCLVPASLANWTAQAVATVSGSFAAQVYLLFLVKAIVIISPPDRLGVVQGIIVALIAVAAMPLIIGISCVAAPDTQTFDLRAVLGVSYVSGLIAILGWIAACIYISCGPAIEASFLPEDEKDTVKRFGVTSLHDATEVLGIDTKELLRRLSSSNVLVQRELQHLWFAKETQDRYRSLCKRVVAGITDAPLEPILKHLPGGVTVASTPWTELLEPAAQAFHGGKGERGEPTVQYLLHGLDLPEHFTTAFVKDFLKMGLPVGGRFGHALGLRTADGPIEAVCVCYPPGKLLDGEPAPIGSTRYQYAVHKSGRNFLSDTMMDATPEILDRFMTTASADLEGHHNEQPPHWYVALLGVVPGNRGKKRGRILLDLVAEWAAEDGVGCYLECGDVNVPIYEACGYHVVWSEQDASDPGNVMSLHGMLRPVQ
eukprot:TRINITY_DN75968_c0_g1_i1.p1 TRINITY_DN75968_c0_g1~~TRINITY_DN75968_c0_g1_i1.p1  ORF type:complete len:779 (+),score=107.92 TRINITY_DN75968_c0_g1_i1:40-2376(+)